MGEEQHTDGKRVSGLYGVDGARNGWVVARAAPDLSGVSIHHVTDLEALFWRVIRDDGLLAIDLPIGLPDSGPRACDRAARALLRRPRASSVFPAPSRAALRGSDYLEACRLNEDALGTRLSRQTYNLLPKIREVDELMWTERQARIYEAHPEVSFMTFASRETGLDTGKKSPQGREERQELLETCLPATDIDALLRSIPRREAPADDCLDALACLVTAFRISAGRAIRVPRNRIEIDSRGLRMEILA